MKSRNINMASSRKGFTLVEILIAMSLSVAALGFGSWFLVEMGRAAFLANEKLDINDDVRDLTNELIDMGRGADLFYLYSEYSSEVYAADEEGNYGGKRLGDGQTGDFLLLVYEDSSTTSRSGYPITKLVGIYRDPTEDSTEAPVKMFVVDSVSSSDEYKKPEQLIPGVLTIGNDEVIVELAEGRADGNLFYNFKDTSVMLNAKIIHGNDAKQITDTYNMTIKPRGGLN